MAVILAFAQVRKVASVGADCSVPLDVFDKHRENVLHVKRHFLYLLPPTMKVSMAGRVWFSWR
ncbi:MAG: hypothetical protein J1E07_06160 [Treponema sp.]|nr:hypothetical protein [Treponema sp.]